MVAMETLIFKLVDPIQEFILRRLFGELQEVKSKSERVAVASVNRDASRGSALICACAFFFFFFIHTSCLTWSGQSCICVSWGSWRSCTVRHHSTAVKCSRSISLNWSSTASRSCKSRASRYKNSSPTLLQDLKKKKNSLFLGYSTLTFFSFSFSLPDSLCGKPGGSSSCYGVPGYGMWSCGAGSDRHGIRNHFWPEITEWLLLLSSIISLARKL